MRCWACQLQLLGRAGMAGCGVFPVASSSCLCAFLEDPVYPDLRWHVIDAQVAGSFGDLPVEGVVGLELEVQEPARVAAVGAAPGVAAGCGLEVSAAEQRRDVIEDGAQQGMGGVGVTPAVVVVQLGDQRGELAGIQADRLGSRRQAGVDVEVNVARSAGSRTGTSRGRPSAARVNTTSPAAWFTDSTRQPASSQALASTLPSLLPHQARCRYADSGRCPTRTSTSANVIRTRVPALPDRYSRNGPYFPPAGLAGAS